MTANKLHIFFFLTTYNFAVVCTFSPRHIGYHLLFITKNVLTTKSHIPDTQKKEETATIFGAGELLHGKLGRSLPGMQSSLGAHTEARGTRIYQDTIEASEASRTPVLFILLAVY